MRWSWLWTVPAAVLLLSLAPVHAQSPTHTPLPTWTPGGVFTATPANTAVPTRTVTNTPVNTAVFTPATIPATRTPTATRPAATATATYTAVLPTPSGSGGCVDAVAVSSLPYSLTEDTSTANPGASDLSPTCSNGSNRRAVWFKYTATVSDGSLTADTFGSNYDTILQVYSNTTPSCTGLAAVASGCNDDISGTVQSKVTFTATPGTTYYFLVSAFNQDGGSLKFELIPTPPAAPTNTAIPARTATNTPVNTAVFTPATIPATRTPTATRPAATATATYTAVPPTPSGSGGCGNAKAVSLGSTTTEDTSTANPGASDPNPTCSNGSNRRAVWFTYTATVSDGSLTADTLGSNYDTILQVYSNTTTPASCTGLAASGCNDDINGTVQSKVTFTATPGTTYYFLVSSFNQDGGSLTFHLNTTPAAAPTNTAIPARTATNTPVNTAVFTPATIPPTRTPTATRPPATATATATATTPPVPGSGGCTHATDVTSQPLPYQTTEDTTGSVTAATDPVPACGNNSNRKAVWFKFTTAGAVASLTVNTYGSNYDTILSAYVDTSDLDCTTAVPVTAGSPAVPVCNDDSNGTVQSKVTLTGLTANTDYYFMVSAYGNDGGTLALKVTTP